MNDPFLPSADKIQRVITDDTLFPWWQKVDVRYHPTTPSSNIFEGSRLFCTEDIFLHSRSASGRQKKNFAQLQVRSRQGGNTDAISDIVSVLSS
jgi:hypothetical protein